MRAELIIHGRIATLAGGRGLAWAECLALGKGRVVAAGRASEVEALRGPDTRTWSLGEDRVVIPGITDAHLHLVTAAISATQLDLSEARHRVAIEALIAAEHARMRGTGDGAGWLLGQGWSMDRFGAWPSAADLDQLTPGRPSALWSHDHHGLWANTLALRAAGISAATPDPEGGLIRRDEHGAPTGMLHEHAAALLSEHVPERSDAQLEVAIGAYARMLAELGVIGAQDPGEMRPDPELTRGPIFFARLASAGRLPLRVASSIRAEQIRRAIELGLKTGAPAPLDGDASPAAARRSERAPMGWLKLFADGSLGSRSAALLEPYEVEGAGGGPVGGPAGMLLDRPDVLAERASAAASAGIAVQIHGIGDRAVRVALDILETLPAMGTVRHRVEHAQLVHPDDQARFGASGIVASVQPCHLGSDAKAARAAWGERTAAAFPLRGLGRGGALLAFGTDAPVEPPDPWPGIALAVTRTDPGWADDGPFHAEQSLDLAVALRAACLGPALAAGESDRGRLVAGQRADLLVVAADVLDEPPTPGGALAHARPQATLLDGEFVYRAADFPFE